MQRRESRHGKNEKEKGKGMTLWKRKCRRRKEWGGVWEWCKK